jgi:hypothetical protein
MDEKTELLVRMYEIQMETGRHTEEQRATATNFTILIAFGIITFFQTQSDKSIKIILLVAVIFLGLYGALISYKLYERFMYHIHEAYHFLKAIDSSVKGLDVLPIIDKSEKFHEQKFPPKWLVKFRLHSAWIGINILITAIGIFLLVYTLI